MQQPNPRPVVLVAPLDWGLGHATRCIPIIRELLAQQATVIIAASGKQKALLEIEFPLMQVLPLPGYQIKYAASGWGFVLKIVAQIPKILITVKNENRWLKQMLASHNIQAVISDNRYGLHSKKIVSIFITHQLHIKTPVDFLSAMLQKINYSFINRFAQCWVPDAAGSTSLAGELSHPRVFPKIPVRFIGSLSRFSLSEGETNQYLLVMLSGPEPQRTVLEKLLLKQLETYQQPVVLVRGLPGCEDEIKVAKNITVYHHLPANQLEAIIKKASMVISRSGYSTVMDLIALKKKSILIATPGQTEQEYLAVYLTKKQYALGMRQKNFNLHKALQIAGEFAYVFPPPLTDNFRAIVADLLLQIAQHK